MIHTVAFSGRDPVAYYKVLAPNGTEDAGIDRHIIEPELSTVSDTYDVEVRPHPTVTRKYNDDFIFLTGERITMRCPEPFAKRKADVVCVGGDRFMHAWLECGDVSDTVLEQMAKNSPVVGMTKSSRRQESFSAFNALMAEILARPWEPASLEVQFSVESVEEIAALPSNNMLKASLTGFYSRGNV